MFQSKQNAKFYGLFFLKNKDRLLQTDYKILSNKNKKIVLQQLSIADNYFKITLLLKAYKTQLTLPKKKKSRSKSDSEFRVQLTFHEGSGWVGGIPTRHCVACYPTWVVMCGSLYTVWETLPLGKTKD
jgi:hypothetical protein